MATLQRGLFATDTGGSETWFPGYYDPRERWNGFAVPYFDRAVGQRIARANRSLARRFGADAVERVQWDGRHQAFLIDRPGEVGSAEVVWGGLKHTVDGTRTLYSIGGRAWTWLEERHWGDARRRRPATLRRVRRQRRDRHGRFA